MMTTISLSGRMRSLMISGLWHRPHVGMACNSRNWWQLRPKLPLCRGLASNVASVVSLVVLSLLINTTVHQVQSLGLPAALFSKITPLKFHVFYPKQQHKKQWVTSLGLILFRFLMMTPIDIKTLQASCLMNKFLVQKRCLWIRKGPSICKSSLSCDVLFTICVRINNSKTPTLSKDELYTHVPALLALERQLEDLQELHWEWERWRECLEKVPSCMSTLYSQVSIIESWWAPWQIPLWIPPLNLNEHPRGVSQDIQQKNETKTYEEWPLTAETGKGVPSTNLPHLEEGECHQAIMLAQKVERQSSLEGSVRKLALGEPVNLQVSRVLK